MLLLSSLLLGGDISLQIAAEQQAALCLQRLSTHKSGISGVESLHHFGQGKKLRRGEEGGGTVFSLPSSP